MHLRKRMTNQNRPTSQCFHESDIQWAVHGLLWITSGYLRSQLWTPDSRSMAYLREERFGLCVITRFSGRNTPMNYQQSLNMSLPIIHNVIHTWKSLRFHGFFMTCNEIFMKHAPPISLLVQYSFIIPKPTRNSQLIYNIKQPTFREKSFVHL